VRHEDLAAIANQPDIWHGIGIKKRPLS